MDLDLPSIPTKSIDFTLSKSQSLLSLSSYFESGDPKAATGHTLYPQIS